MKEKISSLTSSTISALRFPLTVGVVFIHFNVLSDNLAVRGTGNAEHFPTWLVCMFNLFSEVLPRIAVPLFFIISGYLFFRSGFMIRTYTDKLRRRVRTLLVPYILWNLLYLIRTAFRDIPAFSGLSHDTAQANWSLSAVLACFWDNTRGVFPVPASSYIYPQDFPLWYVRDLMVMVVLAPVLYWMLKKVGWLAVVVLGMVWLALHSICNITYWGQFFTAAFFFSWGACYGLKGMDLVASMRHRTWIALLYPLWAVADMLKVEGIYGLYIPNIGLIFGIFSAVVLTAYLLERGVIWVNKFLSDGSFFLYALHALLMLVLARCITKVFFVDSLFYTVSLYFVVPCLTTAVSFGLYELLRRYTPRICAVLTGGR